MPTYRLKEGFNGQDRALPGIGRTVNGVITTDAKIESSIFELVPEPTAPPQAPAAPAAAPQVSQSPPQPSSEQTANNKEAA